MLIILRKKKRRLFFISINDDILKNGYDFNFKKVTKEEKNKEFKIQFINEKIKYKVNLYIDNIFKTYINIINITKENK
jgi:hypothetical protein